jgi:amino acid transporter
MLKSCGTLGGAILLTVETAESDAVLGQITTRAVARPDGRASTANLLYTGVLMNLVVIAVTNQTIARQFTLVADVSVILTVVVYMAACVALWRTSRSVHGGVRLKTRAVAAGGLVFCGWLIVAAEPKLLFWSAGMMAASLLAYAPIRLRTLRTAKALASV